MNAQPALERPIATRIAWNSSLLALGDTASYAIGFATTLLVTKQLGTAYGPFIGAQRFAALFRVVADLGLSVLIVRSFAARRPDADHVYGTVLALRVFSGLLFAAVVAGAAQLTGYLPEYRPILYAFALLQVLGVQAETFTSVLDGREQMGRSAAVRVIRALAMLAGVGVWAACAQGLAAVTAIYVAATALQCATAFAFANGAQPRPRPRVELARTLPLLRESQLYVAVGAAYSILRSTDVVLLARFGSELDGALYGAALNFLELAVFVPLLVQRALLPAFSRPGEPDREHVCAQTLRVFSAVLTPFAVGLAALAPEAVGLYGEPELLGAAPALRVLALTIPLLGVATVAATYLTGIGRVQAVLVVYALALPVQIALCFAWLGDGASGVAWGTWVAHALLALGVLFATAACGVTLPLRAWCVHATAAGIMAALVQSVRPLGAPVAVPAGALAYGLALYLLAGAQSPERRALGILLQQAAAPWRRP